MKKRFFGYKVSEVNAILDTLREENNNLNETITNLKFELENCKKSNTELLKLEEDLIKSEDKLADAINKKEELSKQIASLTKEYGNIKQQNVELTKQYTQTHNKNINLLDELKELQKREHTEIKQEVAVTQESAEIGSGQSTISDTSININKSDLSIEFNGKLTLDIITAVLDFFVDKIIYTYII